MLINSIPIGVASSQNKLIGSKEVGGATKNYITGNVISKTRGFFASTINHSVSAGDIYNVPFDVTEEDLSFGFYLGSLNGTEFSEMYARKSGTYVVNVIPTILFGGATNLCTTRLWLNGVDIPFTSTPLLAPTGYTKTFNLSHVVQMEIGDCLTLIFRNQLSSGTLTALPQSSTYSGNYSVSVTINEI